MSDAFRKVSTVSRSDFGKEYNPMVNNGQLHFNTDTLLLSGKEWSDGDLSESSFLAEAANSALSYPHRNEVRVLVFPSVLFERDFRTNHPWAYSDLEDIVGLSGLLHTNSKDQKLKTLQSFLKQEMESMAIDYTKSLETTPDYEVISPSDPYSLEYEFIFTLPNGKKLIFETRGYVDWEYLLDRYIRHQ